MRRALVALVFAACSSPLPGQTPVPKRIPSVSELSALRFDGIGPATVGMTMAEASEAIGRALQLTPGITANCAFATLVGGPEGLSFMVTRDAEETPWQLQRMDVARPSRIASEAGVRVSTPRAGVRQAYGDKLREEGDVFVVDPDGPDGNLLLLESDGLVVTRLRAGRESAVRRSGCA